MLTAILTTQYCNNFNCKMQTTYRNSERQMGHKHTKQYCAMYILKTKC